MSIRLNLRAVESLLVFWTMVSEKEKVGDSYLHDMAQMEEFQATFDEEFSSMSFVKILSAISNKELLNGMNKKEGKFWTNNMWMLEDMGLTRQMLEPLKKLHLDGTLLSSEMEIVFVPMHSQESFKMGQKLYVNFFKIVPDMSQGLGRIQDQELSIYLMEKLSKN